MARFGIPEVSRLAWGRRFPVFPGIQCKGLLRPSWTERGSGGNL